jgi:Rieske [2Fe-2S] domain
MYDPGTDSCDTSFTSTTAVQGCAHATTRSSPVARAAQQRRGTRGALSLLSSATLRHYIDKLSLPPDLWAVCCRCPGSNHGSRLAPAADLRCRSVETRKEVDMDQTVRLARLEELGERTMKAFDVSRERIAVAVIDGAYYGFEDACPHLQCPLSEGRLSGQTIDLPLPRQRVRRHHRRTARRARAAFAPHLLSAGQRRRARACDRRCVGRSCSSS